MLRFTFRSVMHSLRSNPLLHGAALLTISLCVGLMVFSFSGARLVRSWTSTLDQSVRFVVQVEPSKAQGIEQALGQMPLVQQVEKLGQQAVADSVSRVLGIEAPEVLLSLGLPTLYKVAPNPEDPTKWLDLIERISAIEGVISVEYGQRWLMRFKEFARVVTQASVGLALLLTGTAFVILTTVYTLILYGRRRELEIMVLVGASPQHIYIPVVVEGLLQASLGSALAVGMAYGIWSLVLDEMVVFGAAMSANFNGITTAAYLVLGTLVGMGASAVSMMQTIERVTQQE